MRLFISAGEPSGDLHGGNLIRSLQERVPGLQCVGFGGEHMAAAGCKLLVPLAQTPFIGIVDVLGSIPFFARVLSQADEYFRTQRPDALIVIDNPGLHWHLAARARNRGIPVYYFVAPQIWAWAQWRVRKMRRLVNHVLCTLPFEEPWYRRHHVPVTYIGHPYFDALPRQQLDPSFMQAQQGRPGAIVALLPGSRNSELQLNVPTLLRAAQLIHQRRPHVRFLVACLKPAHERQVKAQTRGLPVPIEVHSGRTPEIIELAHSCLAVSGSVGLELLYRHKPSVVIYRQTRFHLFVAGFLKKSRYISIVNLIAGKELFPEYLMLHCRAEEMAAHVLHWLDDPAAYDAMCLELQQLCGRVAVPGACNRAAEVLLEHIGTPRVRARQAA